MAILNQDSTLSTYYLGWYGNCTENCSDQVISNITGVEKISRIYQFAGDNIFLMNWTGLANNFTNLECGLPYLIVLKSGTGSVTIPNFIVTNIDSVDLGRITDSCSAETYSLSIVNESLQDSTTAYPHNENESLTFKLTTTGLNQGDTVAWEISGSNITLDDFVGLSSLTGNFTLDVNGESLLPIQLNEDSSTEGSETFRLSLVNQTSVYIDVPVDDTSQSPHTYLLEDAGNYTFADENDFSYMTINLITSEPIGNFIPFTVSGSGITFDDFSNVSPAIDSNLQGNFEITSTISGGVNDGKNYGQVAFTIDEDSTTEGTEVFTITLDDHPSVSFTIDIQDTSQTPSQLVLSTTHTELDEGVFVNNSEFTEISLGTSDGTLLNPGDTHKIKLTGSGITPDDFKWSYWSDEYNYFEFDSSMEVDFVVDGNGYADGIMLTTKADSTTEGPETVRVILVDDPNVFVDIDINDTSTTQLVLTANFPAPPIDEGTHTKILLNWTEQNLTPGDSYDFVITGSNITPDDFEYWLDPSGVQQQFDSSLQGTLVVNSNGNAFTEIKASIDSTVEGPETFTVSLVNDPNVFVDVDINDLD